MSIEPSPEGPTFATRDIFEPVIVTTHEVPRERTPLTDAELRTALAAGHVLAFEAEASPVRLDVATAMVEFETDHGHALWCFNFGNVDAAQGWTGGRFSLVADEGSGDSTHSLRKMLRAYPSADEGAAGYWRYLAEHHGAALAAFDSGDGDRAARALKASGYFTGSVEAYAAGVASLARSERRKRGG